MAIHERRVGLLTLGMVVETATVERTQDSDELRNRAPFLLRSRALPRQCQKDRQGREDCDSSPDAIPRECISHCAFSEPSGPEQLPMETGEVTVERLPRHSPLRTSQAVSHWVRWSRKPMAWRRRRRSGRWAAP